MATPNWLWAKSAGSTQWDFAGLDYGSSTIATNQFGHSHVVGRVGGQASFPPQTMTDTAYPKVFVESAWV